MCNNVISAPKMEHNWCNERIKRYQKENFFLPTKVLKEQCGKRGLSSFKVLCDCFGSDNNAEESVFDNYFQIGDYLNITNLKNFYEIGSFLNMLGGTIGSIKIYGIHVNEDNSISSEEENLNSMEITRYRTSFVNNNRERYAVVRDNFMQKHLFDADGKNYDLLVMVVNYNSPAYKNLIKSELDCEPTEKFWFIFENGKLASAMNDISAIITNDYLIPFHEIIKNNEKDC